MVHHGLQIANAARVLAVVQEPVLAELVRLALNHAPLFTRIAHRGDEAEALLAEWKPHLAIVDADIGRGELLDRMQATPTPLGRIPIIALTQRGDLRTKLAAFERGVDDILAVPFSSEELVARTLAVMRRAYREPLTFTPSIQIGNLEIDMLHRQVRVEGHELHLTSLELNLLYLLAANAGQVVTREQIMDSLWGADYVAESNVVDRHVRNLREKLQNSWRRPQFIATVPGQGYQFVMP